MNPVIQEHVSLFLQSLGFDYSSLRAAELQPQVQVDLGHLGMLYLEDSNEHLLVGLVQQLPDHEVEDCLQSLLETAHGISHGLFDIQIGLKGQNQPVVAAQLPFHIVTNSVIAEAVNVAVDVLNHQDRGGSTL